MRDGARLIVRRGGALPPTCVKCGTIGGVRRYKFAWLQPGYMIFLLLGILPYLLLRPFLRKTIRLGVPLCSRHQANASRLSALAFAALAISVPVGFGVGEQVGDIEGAILGFAAGFFLVILGLILLWTHYPLHAVLIDDERAVFMGAHDAFLRLLPPLMPERAPTDTYRIRI